MIMDIEFYAKKIFGFARSKTNNVQDAEDLSQEILISLFNSAEKINKVENVDAYVYKICAYTWSNFYRREKRHWNSINLDTIYDFNNMNEIEELIENNEMQRLLLVMRKEIAYMNKLNREILVKSYFENKTIKQISEELSIPEGTVKWYIYEAKRKLKGDIRMNDNTQSYRPIKMLIGHCGSPGKNNEPNSYFNSLLYQNIAFAAYKEALTIEELSRKLEVGCAFVEEALDNLVYSDLVKKIGNKYQTAFFISKPEDKIPLRDLMIEKSQEIAEVIFSVLKKAIPNIKAVGFIGSELDEDILLWTLFPYYITPLFDEAEDYRAFSKYEAPEHKDGGKYIANGALRQEDSFIDMENKNYYIYQRYECEGLKFRTSETNLYSYQIDSYFQGLKWREFYGADLEKLWRIAYIVRNSLEPNEFEKVIIAEYVNKGYLSIVNGEVRFKFPIMAKEEKETVDKIIETEFKTINIKELFEGLTTKCYKLRKSLAPLSIPDNDIKYRAINDVMNVILGCMEYMERIGKLRTPTEEEKGALTTLIWKK
jgi:RNA polymerase sigma factor (sigma-70 family)